MSADWTFAGGEDGCGAARDLRGGVACGGKEEGRAVLNGAGQRRGLRAARAAAEGVARLVMHRAERRAVDLRSVCN